MNFISDIILRGSLFLLANPEETGYATSNWPSTFSMIGQFFFLAVIFVFVIFLAVYSLKIASRFKGYAGVNDNLRIVESRALGGQNFVHIIKAGGKYFLLGSSKENVSFLSEIDAESVTDIYESGARTSFDEAFSNSVKKLFKKDSTPED